MKNTLKNIINKKEIEKILKVKIKHKNIWLQALIHKSWTFFHKEYRNFHNERLEFLGDSVLQTITSFYLFKNFPYLGEGEMSLIRASLVNRDRLGQIAKKLNLEKILLFAKNFDEKGLKTVLGNSFEAIIGAIFLDSGFEEAREFVEREVLKETKEIINFKNYKDPKTILQEIFQKKYGELPDYRILDISGKEHNRKFKVGIYFHNKKISEGEGSSKKEAEFKAALKIVKIKQKPK